MADHPTSNTQPSKFTAQQRRMLLCVCFIVAGIAFVPSTFNFVVNPMLSDFDASETQRSILRQLPSIAALLVIFVSGSLGKRVGVRRAILACGTFYTIGCAIVVIAPGFGIATVGLVTLSAASSALAVIALGLLSAEISNPKLRASAFSTFAIVAPAVFAVIPVLAGALLDRLSWRAVTVIWLIGGVVIVLAARKLLTLDNPAKLERCELWTPILAGLTLASGVQTITAISADGLTSTGTLVRFITFVVFLAAVTAAYRRTDKPSLSLAALRGGGMTILLVVVIVMPFVNLWFYMTLGYQYVFGLSAVETALLMVPPQVAGIVGAIISKRIIQRQGITTAGVLMLLLLAVSLLASTLILISSPIALVVAVMSLYAFAFVGATVPVTNAIMNTAPKGEEAGASAFRGAAGAVGTAIGVIIMAAIVFNTAANSLSQSLEAEGIKSEQSAEIAYAIRDGASTEEASSQFAVPLDQTEDIDEHLDEAMIDGLHAHGYAGAGFITVAAVVFWLGRRRQQEIADE